MTHDFAELARRCDGRVEYLRLSGIGGIDEATASLLQDAARALRVLDSERRLKAETELTTKDVKVAYDAWVRGFGGAYTNLLGQALREVLLFRGITVLPCSLCGEDLLAPGPHSCDRTKWKT